MDRRHVTLSNFLHGTIQDYPGGIPLVQLPSILKAKFDPEFTPYKYGHKDIKSLVVQCLPPNVELRNGFGTEGFRLVKSSQQDQINKVNENEERNLKDLKETQQYPNQVNVIPNKRTSDSSLKVNYSRIVSKDLPKENIENHATLNKLKFIHEAEDFKNLIDSCAREFEVEASYIEKDYYVSHSLWCLRKKGLEIQVKGGVSLSKGYGVLQRLSEDVDVIIHPGASCPPSLQTVVGELYNTDRKSKQKTPDRFHLWRKFANLVRYSFPGMEISVGGRTNPFFEPRWTHLVLVANYNSFYPVKDENLLPSNVMLELSVAREEEEPLPPIQLRLSSLLHNYLEQKKMLYRFKRNIPTALCTHPMITLIQKIADGIIYRYPRSVSSEIMPPFASGLRGKVPPFDPRIVRHYEDAAAIILQINRCYPPGKLSQYELLFIQLIERRMLRRKIEEGTIIHTHESLYLEDQEKLNLLQKCQQQRICLYYEFKKVSTSNNLINNSTSTSNGRSSRFIKNESSNSLTLPLPLNECAIIIREWLEKIGL